MQRLREEAARRSVTEKPGSASIGPYTQPDPIGFAGGLNLYGYAGGDPVNNSDPFGLDHHTVELGLEYDTDLYCEYYPGDPQCAGRFPPRDPRDRQGGGSTPADDVGGGGGGSGRTSGAARDRQVGAGRDYSMCWARAGIAALSVLGDIAFAGAGSAALRMARLGRIYQTYARGSRWGVQSGSLGIWLLGDVNRSYGRAFGIAAVGGSVAGDVELSALSAFNGFDVGLQDFVPFVASGFAIWNAASCFVRGA
jgi:hypothetical protein